MQNLHLLEFFSRSFSPSIENGAHATKKLLLKTQVRADFA